MSYVDQVLASVKEKNAHEPEFLQTTTEVLNSLRGVLERHPEYQKAKLLERLVEPERIVTPCRSPPGAPAPPGAPGPR